MPSICFKCSIKLCNIVRAIEKPLHISSVPYIEIGYGNTMKFYMSFFDSIFLFPTASRRVRNDANNGVERWAAHYWADDVWGRLRRAPVHWHSRVAVCTHKFGCVLQTRQPFFFYNPDVLLLMLVECWFPRRRHLRLAGSSKSLTWYSRNFDLLVVSSRHRTSYIRVKRDSFTGDQQPRWAAHVKADIYGQHRSEVSIRSSCNHQYICRQMLLDANKWGDSWAV